MTDNDREQPKQMRLYVRPHYRLRRKTAKRNRNPTLGQIQRFHNYLKNTSHVRYPDPEKLIERLCK